MAIAVGALVFAGVASAAASPAEQQLAAKFAPELRMKAQEKPCGKGDPYIPTNVDLVLGRDDVVLRGPWDRTNVFRFNPTAKDLAGRAKGTSISTSRALPCDRGARTNGGRRASTGAPARPRMPGS